MKKMKAKKTEDYHTEVYKWKFKGLGLFKAVITNGELESLDFCERGDSVIGALDLDNMIYLKAVHQALGELFKILEKDKK